MSQLTLYNSLSRKIEVFVPLAPPKVSLYTCGITAYDYAHIGHGRKYVNDDILRRTLQRFGYRVEHVQNVTDVGHLVSDADEGEDKLEKGARKAGKTVWEVATYFADDFYAMLHQLNVLSPSVICKATEHIPEQIKLVQQLLEKGFAYETEQAIYFDVKRFPSYGQLGGQKLDEKQVAVRDEVQGSEDKRHPADFALWFKRIGRFADHAMHWESPWGDGFPGWHIECSAMSMRYLGATIDIHTGGVDHLTVHHPNEIAQSEAATGKQFVRCWIHHEMLLVNGQKMSKSLENTYRLADVEAKGFAAMDLRYFYLAAHYRKQQNFTWEALQAAREGRMKLVRSLQEFTTDKTITASCSEFEAKFSTAIGNDLNTPEALAVVWELLKAKLPPAAKFAGIMRMDEVLGLQLQETVQQLLPQLPDKIEALRRERDRLRAQNNWQQADALRHQIEEEGYRVEDTGDESKVYKA